MVGGGTFSPLASVSSTKKVAMSPSTVHGRQDVTWYQVEICDVRVTLLHAAFVADTILGGLA